MAGGRRLATVLLAYSCSATASVSVCQQCLECHYMYCQSIELNVLISFIYNLGLTIKPIRGPPWGVYLG
jgi:hypothetical protein